MATVHSSLDMSMSHVISRESVDSPLNYAILKKRIILSTFSIFKRESYVYPLFMFLCFIVDRCGYEYSVVNLTLTIK